MVHEKDSDKQAFARRLCIALERMGINRYGAGEYLRSQTGTTVKSANNWLNGEKMPFRKRIKLISEILGVRVEWLEYGIGSMLDEGNISNQIEESAAQYISSLPFEEITSPRSKSILEKLVNSVAQGILTEDDLEFLDQMATRLAEKSGSEGNAAHNRLRNKLQNDDSNSEA